MTRKASFIALVLCLFLTLLGPPLAQAQVGLTVVEASTEVQYPLRLQFNLSAASDADITDIRLRYVIEYMSFTDVISESYIEFVPASRVNVSWSLEMIKIGGLPPGTIINYWWVLSDARGQRLETKPARAQFDDNRFQWQDLTEGNIKLRWYEGGPDFARELMLAAQQALSRLNQSTGARLERPVEIYIYASPQDLLGAMIHPQEWTGGVAYPAFGTIAIGIGTDRLSWGKGAIAHELSHMVTSQMTLNPYSGVPTWLDEGLAVYGEGSGGAEYMGFLQKAIENRSLISVRSLCSPFSAITELAYLSYAESFSIVDYLITRYGREKMLELLNTFRQGNTYDEALKKVYGFDVDGLNTRWQEYVTRK